jgi:hypothetical protein
MARKPPTPEWRCLWLTTTSAGLLLLPRCSPRTSHSQPRGRGLSPPPPTSPVLTLVNPSQLSPASECLPRASRVYLASPGAGHKAPATGPPGGSRRGSTAAAAALAAAENERLRCCTSCSIITIVVFLFCMMGIFV